MVWVAIVLTSDNSRELRHERLLKEEQEARKVRDELERDARRREKWPHPDHADPWRPPDVSDKPPYPKVALSEQIFDFGKMPSGTKQTHKFRVKNAC